MATMFQTWTIFTAVTVLVVQLCIGDKSCTIWSSAGPMVRRGSSFTVYCTFNCKCKGSMSSDHPPTPQRHQDLNSTTIYFKVANITKNRTYSCHCKCPSPLDPCGLDISAGYLPERPKNISCIYKVKGDKGGDVFCTWNRGWDTFLWNSSALWVRTVSGNHTDTPVDYKVSNNRNYILSANFKVPGSVRLISVWVRTNNPLGSATSATVNYKLSDIAMPSTPVLGRPECSSRGCNITVEQPGRTRHLEIQYSTETHTWTSSSPPPDSMSSVQVRSVSSLDPYTLYHFRARSKFSTGLWSQWSANISSWTQEEAPAKALDVWFAETAADFRSLRVYWKELDVSVARGKIAEYDVKVYNQNSGLLFHTNVSADVRNCSVPFCAGCEVKVWARNSKGPSPPARITTRHTKVKVPQFQPPGDVNVAAADNHNVSISWRRPDAAPLHAVYVVEWYPEGRKLEELRWLRLGRDDNHTVVTGIKPFECYEGAVHVFYKESSVSRTRSPRFTTLESAPAAGPSVQETVEGNQVKVTWTEIPRGQRGGCVTTYTVYLENDSGRQQPYSIPASERMHVIRGLSPAVYSLWMTASTAKGEGPPGQKVKFFIQEETQLSPLLVCAVVAPIVMIVMCLYHSSALKQRFWVYFQCLMLDVVPDPANSKWAKECTQEKGKMNLHLQLSNASVTKEEEEPIMVDVEELPKQSSDISAPPDVSSQLSPQTGLSPDAEPATLLYPLTTYIKSFSQDSDSSDHTQTSLDTNTTTVGYISSQEPGDMDEEEEEEEEDEFVEMLGFFPSHNSFMEPLDFGGKLSLSAVKIDCSDFFQNSSLT